MGDVEGTLGSGPAATGGGVSFDTEKVEAGQGVPTGDQKPSDESADVENVTEKGEGGALRLPEKEK
jgi:hypothetical protein